MERTSRKRATNNRVTPRLAVIVHGDVAGSTLLVQRDERLAHERITDVFGRFSKLIENYGGVVHEIRGDALVAEFARASDAVCSALAFQEGNTAHNKTLDDDIIPEVRIGISLGEVVIADNTVTGAGVVLAQRVEQLAEPGGVCTTEAIHEAIPERLPLDYENLGEQALKGFEQQVRVHAVHLQAGIEVPPPEPQQTTKRKQTPLVVATMAAALFVAIALAWFKPWQSDDERTSVEWSLPDKPSIAILPFDNLSADPDQEYFSDGMTDDLITDLSKISGMYVVSRNSSFRYKHKQASPEQIGRELNVRYILEGSVRRAANQLRINARLIDTITGYHLWAERFDWKMEDIFTAQDQLTEKIATALEVHMAEDERERVVYRLTSNLDAYDLYLRGLSYYELYTKEGNARSRRMFLKAIELDSKFAAAYAILADNYSYDWDAQYDDVPNALDRSVESAQMAVALDEGFALAHQYLGWSYMWKKQPDKAIASGRRAIALDPNLTSAQAFLGEILNFAGRPEEGLELINKAIHLNPYHPFWYKYILAHSYDLIGRQQEAIELMKKVLAVNPDFLPANRHLVVIYSELNRMEEARSEITKILRVSPGYSISEWRARARYSDPAILQRFAENLRKAGLPE